MIHRATKEGDTMQSHMRRSSPTLPDSIPISVIIPSGNEERTIGKVIAEAQKISRNTEVIVVCNGVTDRTVVKARKTGATVLEYIESLGHDVGRAIGAKAAKGDVLLFIDADFVVPCSILRQYCLEVINGWDVVLNTYSGVGTHPTAEAKKTLNYLLGRPDLMGSSFTTVPHACSRRAVEIIGYANLAVPPKAQVISILNQLKITRGRLVKTNRLNRIRRGRKISIQNLVLGDHVEAICQLIQDRGDRGGFTDFQRQRFALFNGIDQLPVSQLQSGGEEIQL